MALANFPSFEMVGFSCFASICIVFVGQFVEVLVLPFRKSVSSRILYKLKNNGKAKKQKRSLLKRNVTLFLPALSFSVSLSCLLYCLPTSLWRSLCDGLV